MNNRTPRMAPAARQIAYINAAHGLCHYSLLILPTAVLAMVAPGGAFGAEYGPVVTLATGGFVLYGLLSLPQGWLAERIGRKALIAAFFLGTGASLALCGLTGTPAGLALGLAAAGAFAAIYHPVGTAMLVEAAGNRPGRAIGVNGVFGNFGVALAPVVTGVLAGRLGWHAAFVVPGLACIAAGLLWLRVPAYEYRRGPQRPALPGHPARRGAPGGRGAAADRGGVRAGVQRLHPAVAEAVAGAAGGGRHPAAADRRGGVPGDAVRRADAVDGRAADRPDHAAPGLPADGAGAGAGAAGAVGACRAGRCCRWPGWRRR